MSNSIKLKHEFEHHGLKCVVMQLGYDFDIKKALNVQGVKKLSKSLYDILQYDILQDNWFVGYVRINARTHPAVYNDEKDYELHSFDVHGGITYTGASIRDESEDSNYCWLGWDGNHGTKFSLEEAINETKELAEQLYLTSPEAYDLI
jgi:hypothetical protein